MLNIYVIRRGNKNNSRNNKNESNKNSKYKYSEFIRQLLMLNILYGYKY